MIILNRRAQAEDSGERRAAQPETLDGPTGHAPDSATPAKDRDRGDSPAAPVSLAAACPADSFWERWCRNASPEQKQNILPDALRSGLVQLHHLPVPGLQASRNAVQNLIASVVANRPPTPEPVIPGGVEVLDDALDEDQRHAVAVALASPDLSLILGYPGSGKSRVVAEILRQCVRRSERVLFVAPTGSPLDRVIDRAPDLRSHVLRCAGAGETPPPSSVRISLQERIRDFDRRTLPAARQAVQEASRRLAAHSALEDAWPRLRATPARLDALAARRAALERRRDSLASSVEREGYSGEPEWAEAEQGIDARLREIPVRLQALADEAARLAAERVPLAALDSTRRGGRWWCSSFWKARRADPAPRLAELDRLLSAHAAEQAALEQERAALEEARRRAAVEHAARVAERCRAEVARREADIARELREADAEAAALRAEWGAVLPAEVHPDAAETAERAWRADHESVTQDLEWRRTWLAALGQARPGLASDLIVGARILAAPVSELLSLGGDRSPGPFDLLVVEDAHRLAEKDLSSLARLAPRCALVGEPAVPIPPSLAPKRGGPPRPADAACGNVFLRLWAALHPDPVGVSATWTRRGDRLVVRLRDFGPEDEGQIGREPVFDRPEIELAIRTPPGGDPHVVEVSFPGSMGVAGAKEFLYREAGDLSVHAPDPCCRWREEEDGVHLLLGSCATTPDGALDLDAGIVEHLGRAESSPAGEPAWHTRALSFARAHGWDRGTAAAWLAGRLGLRDAGRTACLSHVHRARPALAAFLGALLFPRRPASAQPLPSCDAAEFVPVPAAGLGDRTPARNGGRDDTPPHAGGTATLARPRAGAGYEVELADARRLDAIGAELRAGLPPRGIANLPEARLVVQTLESLAGDPSSLGPVAETEPHAAVLSVYPAQVELLRLLVRQSAALAASGLRVAVGTPAALAHRECPLVCLSLTRSHPNRAVPFSDDPRDLVLALTRPTGRLLVFGDPGTVARRTQWFGALDPLTESTGPVEQHLLARLLAHLPDRACPGVARESSGV